MDEQLHKTIERTFLTGEARKQYDKASQLLAQAANLSNEARGIITSTTRFGSDLRQDPLAQVLEETLSITLQNLSQQISQDANLVSLSGRRLDDAAVRAAYAAGATLHQINAFAKERKQS